LKLVLEYYHDFKIIIRLDMPLMGEVFFVADRVFAGLMGLRGTGRYKKFSTAAVNSGAPSAV
jgi:hypothetical protein